MTVSVAWDNAEKTTLRLAVEGDDWGWEDLVTACHQASELMTSVGHAVEIITSFRGDSKVMEGPIGRLIAVPQAGLSRGA